MKCECTTYCGVILTDWIRSQWLTVQGASGAYTPLPENTHFWYVISQRFIRKPADVFVM